MKKFFIFLIVALLAISLVACGSGDPPAGDPPAGDPPVSDPPATDPPAEEPPADENKDFTGITFENKTVNYNGTEQSVVISGTLPTGASVAYTGNTATDAGTYNATAVITCEGYNTLTLTATLTVNKISLTGVTFSSDSFEYDTERHSISITGNIPDDANVTYTGGEDGKNGATNPGEYNITVVVTSKNYTDYTATAKLTVTPRVELKNFSGITFGNKTVNYNGTEQSVVISGTLPTGASVAYTGNTATDAGTYNATAVITCEGYNTLTLTATLTVNKISLTGVTFSSDSFEYDTERHSISITGNIPDDANVTYTGGEDGKNGATNPGKYDITVVITSKNFIDFTATARLTVTSKEEALSVAFSNGKIYFQNPLDKNRLYAVADGLSLVSKDAPEKMITVGNKMYYVSKGLLSSGVYVFDPSTGKSDCLLEGTIGSIASDGTYLYYSINKLLSTEENGIWKVKLSDLNDGEKEISPVRLTSSVASELVVAEGYIYFSNSSDGGKLYAISTGAGDALATKIYDYKVTDLTLDGKTVYFTRQITLSNMSFGAAIYSINVDGGLNTQITDESNRVTKITVSKGKYLTVIGDYIYFVNTDMLSSTIFGDGIYRAKKDGSGIVGDMLALLTGASKVVDGAEDSIYALASDGETLYYYRASDKHLHAFDIGEESETDLMDGFVPPETPNIITTYYEKAEEYNGSIYYINMNDGGRLYRYTPASGLDVRITHCQVADFAVNDGVLYYTSVRFLVNFDLYRMSLATGEPEIISTDKCMNFSFFGNVMYYTNYSDSNTLNCLNLETLEDTVVFDEKSVSSGSTVIYGGCVYFVAKDVLYRYSIEEGTAEAVNTGLKPLEYLIHDGKILLMNTSGVKNHVAVYDIATDTVWDIADMGYSVISDDARGMFVYGGDMYFYRNVAAGSSNKGLYKVAISDGEYTAELVDSFDGYYITNSIVIGNNVYFTDVWQVKDSIPTPSSSASLCVLNMSTKQIAKIN